MNKNKKYTAIIEVDDDKWAKHPYGIRIFDENDNQVYYMNFMNSPEECYKISDQYDIPRSEIRKEYY